jgi:hypothetical protein
VLPLPASPIATKRTGPAAPPEPPAPVPLDVLVAVAVGLEPPEPVVAPPELDVVVVPPLAELEVVVVEPLTLLDVGFVVELSEEQARSRMNTLEYRMAPQEYPMWARFSRRAARARAQQHYWQFGG